MPEAPCRDSERSTSAIDGQIAGAAAWQSRIRRML